MVQWCTCEPKTNLVPYVLQYAQYEISKHIKSSNLYKFIYNTVIT